MPKGSGPTQLDPCRTEGAFQCECGRHYRLPPRRLRAVLDLHFKTCPRAEHMLAAKRSGPDVIVSDDCNRVVRSSKLNTQAQLALAANIDPRPLTQGYPRAKAAGIPAELESRSG